MPDCDRARTHRCQLSCHASYLRGLARRLCRSQLDSDDLLQDVLEKALRSPVPEGANERAWLGRVMRNLFIDQVRRRRVRREELVADLEAAPAPTEEAGAWWQALSVDDVRAQLAALTDEQRETFELFAFEGRPYDEIAARQGTRKATVGTRILRARLKLRELLVAAHA